MASLEELLCALKPTSAKGGAAPSAVIDKVQEWKGMGESILYSLANSLSDIDSREEKLKLASESLEARFRDLKEKEGQLELFDEGRRAALQFMEEKLKLKDEELDEELKKLKLKDENLDEQLKKLSEELESLEVKQDEAFHWRIKEREKLKEIEKREKELDMMERSMEERSGEIEKREKKFDAYRDEKLRELALKEEVLVREKREFAEKIRLMSEDIKEKQKAGNAVITERSQSAQNSVCRIRGFLDDKFKEIESRETMAHESLSARLNEADLIQESLEKRFKELEDFEKKLNFSQDENTKTLKSKEGQVGTVRIDRVKSGLQILENKDEEKKQELELKQVNLVSREMEHDCQEQDCGEKSLSSERESAQTCVKAKLASTKLDHLREVELKQRLQGSEQPASTAATNVHSSTNQEKSLDLTHALLKDRMTLAMVINGPENDPELMGSEIFKILSLSSDPAKVVLDTVEMVYAHCSAMLDMEYKERKRTILLLDQLAILSPNIHPLVTEAAIKLALEWKSTISSTKNPMEALVFLNLVAAYKLSSHFDQEELFSLLMVASKHKQTPVLCHTLGLVPRIPGYIQKLINEKKFLLASTFVYEYQFQDRFSQADILNNYTAHVRFSANKCRSQNNSLQAQKIAVGNEIAALRLAIKHISQYGLESIYSPNALAARIKQLEGTRATLRRNGKIQKQGEGGGCWQNRNRKAQLDQALRDELRESSSIHLNPQMAVPRQGSNGACSSPASAWTPKHQAMSQPETGGSSNRRFPVYSVPMHRHVGPYKRRRTDPWMNDGGFREAQFASSQH